MLLSLLSQQSRLQFHQGWYRAGLAWHRHMAALGGGGMMPVGSGGMMPVFPLACATLIPTIHTLATVILIGLIFREIASHASAAPPRQ